jgi:hypothetical protein
VHMGEPGLLRYTAALTVFWHQQIGTCMICTAVSIHHLHAKHDAQRQMCVSLQLAVYQPLMGTQQSHTSITAYSTRTGCAAQIRSQVSTIIRISQVATENASHTDKLFDRPIADVSMIVLTRCKVNTGGMIGSLSDLLFHTGNSAMLYEQQPGCCIAEHTHLL